MNRIMALRAADLANSPSTEDVLERLRRKWIDSREERFSGLWRSLRSATGAHGQSMSIFGDFVAAGELGIVVGRIDHLPNPNLAGVSTREFASGSRHALDPRSIQEAIPGGSEVAIVEARGLEELSAIASQRVSESEQALSAFMSKGPEAPPPSIQADVRRLTVASSGAGAFLPIAWEIENLRRYGTALCALVAREALWRRLLQILHSRPPEGSELWVEVRPGSQPSVVLWINRTELELLAANGSQSGLRQRAQQVTDEKLERDAAELRDQLGCGVHRMWLWSIASGLSSAELDVESVMLPILEFASLPRAWTLVPDLPAKYLTWGSVEARRINKVALRAIDQTRGTALDSQPLAMENAAPKVIPAILENSYEDLSTVSRIAREVADDPTLVLVFGICEVSGSHGPARSDLALRKRFETLHFR